MTTVLDYRFFLEPANGKPIPLRGHVSLGRARTNTVQIGCDKASRRHALIHEDEEGACMVIDLGSSNGTYVNGSRISHLAHLKPGDSIEIGSEGFTLRACQAESPAGEAGPVIAAGAHFSPCWILIGDQENAPEPGESIDDTFKTTVGWVQACRQILKRHHASLPADFDEKLFGYWPDPQHDPAVATAVTAALRELQAIQGRRRGEFRMALHFGMVVIGASGPRRKNSLIGTEVTFVFHMQRLAWVLGAPCLVSEQANRRISQSLPTRALEPCGLHSYQGDRQFFTL